MFSDALCAENDVCSLHLALKVNYYAMNEKTSKLSNQFICVKQNVPETITEFHNKRQKIDCLKQTREKDGAERCRPNEVDV